MGLRRGRVRLNVQRGLTAAASASHCWMAWKRYYILQRKKTKTFYTRNKEKRLLLLSPMMMMLARDCN